MFTEPPRPSESISPASGPALDYQALFEAAARRSIVLSPDLDFRIRVAGEEYAQVRGVTPAALVGRRFFDAFPALRSALHETFATVLRSGNPQPAVTPARDAEGTLRALIYRPEEHRREDEEGLRLRATTEAELLKSRSFSDSLVENIPIMVFVKDARDLRFVRFNKAGEKLLGFSRDELIGKNDYDFFPKEQADHFTAKDRAVLSGSSVVDIPEEPIQTKQGVRILHTKKIPLYGLNGQVEYLLGVSEDITERQQAEKEQLRLIEERAALAERERTGQRSAFLAEASTILTQSLNYHETLNRIATFSVSHLADWCTVTIRKEDGTLERVSAVHREADKIPLINELASFYPPNDTQREGMAAVIHSGQASYTRLVTDELLATAAQSPRHLEVMRALGCRSCIVVPIPARGKIHGAIALVAASGGRIYEPEDLALAEELGRRAGIAIDNALLYAAAQQAVEARDDFMSIASHELKTPITSLKLQLQMSQRRLNAPGAAPVEPRLRKAIDTSLLQIDRLTTLVEDLLDVSRIHTGKLTFNFAPVNVGDLTREVLESFADQLVSSRCELRVDVPADLHARWDQGRIEQVLTNLLSNAIKYAPGQPIDVSVESEGDRAYLRVRDHGPGIPADRHQRIFERFERATSSRSISGLGLGLFICKQIVESHGGTIHVDCTTAPGSTFIVELPLNPPNLGDLADRADPASPSAPAPRT